MTGSEAELVTVRVHVHEVWQLSFAMDAMFSVFGSPGVVGLPGSAFRYASGATSSRSPARAARRSSTRPPPISNGVAGVAESSFRTPCASAPSPGDVVKPVVISADLSWFGVQVGLSLRSSATAPAACGLDMEVPLMIPYSGIVGPTVVSGVLNAA